MSEHPVRHLLWSMLIALRTATEDESLHSEAARRRWLAEWLQGAGKTFAWRGLAPEIATLRQLLDTRRDTPIDELLNTLYVNSEFAEQCDMFRFRAAMSQLTQRGWRTGICRYPDEIVPQLLDRARDDRCHILQLTRTEENFAPTGVMTEPVTFHLLLKQDRDDDLAEQIFHQESFQVVRGGEKSLRKHVTVRTLFIGLPTLPESAWGARENPARPWSPGNSTLH